MFWKERGGLSRGSQKGRFAHIWKGEGGDLGPSKGGGGGGGGFGLSQEPQGWRLGPDPVDGKGIRICLASVNI